MSPSRAFALSLALLAAACGPAPEPAEEAPALAPEAPAAAPAAPPAAEERPGRDLTELVVCDLVPGEEVASALGGTLYAEPAPTASGSLWNECAYLVRIDPAQPVARLASVRFYAPEHFEVAKQLADSREEVGGLGDEAFAVEEPPLHSLTVLRRDDVAFEVRAETSAEDARAIAELVDEKLDELPPA